MKTTVDRTVRVELEDDDRTYLEWQNIDNCVYISVNTAGVFVDVGQIDALIEGLTVLRTHIDKENKNNG